MIRLLYTIYIRVDGIHRDLVLRGITDETLAF